MWVGEKMKLNQAKKCTAVRAHYSRLMKNSLKRGGGWEATFQCLVVYAYLVGTASVLNRTDSKSGIIIV